MSDNSFKQLSVEEVKQAHELMQKEEEIIPELKDHLQTSSTGQMMVHHPLLIWLFVVPRRFGLVNHTYRKKKKAIEKALKDQDYFSHVILHERPYRVGVIIDVADKIDDETYWKLVGDYYADSESLWQDSYRWKKLLSSSRPHREQIMCHEDRVVFNSLSAELTIYRGYAFSNRVGWSWTLDKKKAVWFANRFTEVSKAFPQAIKAKVKKSDVIAYFDCRKEKEIVVDPKLVAVTSEEDVERNPAYERCLFMSPTFPTFGFLMLLMVFF